MQRNRLKYATVVQFITYSRINASNIKRLTSWEHDVPWVWPTGLSNCASWKWKKQSWNDRIGTIKSTIPNNQSKYDWVNDSFKTQSHLSWQYFVFPFWNDA